jgi:hypothetical protein
MCMKKPEAAALPDSAGDAFLRLNDFAGLDAAGADAQLLRAALNLGLDRAQVDVPAAACDIVRVRDIVSELRTLAADLTNLCHDKLQTLNCSRALRLFDSLVSQLLLAGEAQADGHRKCHACREFLV